MIRAALIFVLACILSIVIYQLAKAAEGDNPMPPVAVLFLCKSEPDGTVDPNEEFTHHRNRKWSYENSKMTCRREEVQLYDPVAGQKLNDNDKPTPELSMTFGGCQRAAVMLASKWEIDHPSSIWMVWRVACPTPIMDLRTGHIVGWKLPECSHYDTVVCEADTAI